MKYEQTVRDIKTAVAAKLGVPVENQQLFWHRRELTEEDDGKTLLDMNMHTGFSLRGYDLVSHVESLSCGWRNAGNSLHSCTGTAHNGMRAKAAIKAKRRGP